MTRRDMKLAINICQHACIKEISPKEITFSFGHDPEHMREEKLKCRKAGFRVQSIGDHLTVSK